jgi:hypothetical protein
VWWSLDAAGRRRSGPAGGPTQPARRPAIQPVQPIQNRGCLRPGTARTKGSPTVEVMHVTQSIQATCGSMFRGLLQYWRGFQVNCGHNSVTNCSLWQSNVEGDVRLWRCDLEVTPLSRLEFRGDPLPGIDTQPCRLDLFHGATRCLVGNVYHFVCESVSTVVMRARVALVEITTERY